ncbi:MAG: peptidylprolyl isomerase, partial [Oscillospiraceae bacterium]
APKTVENFTTHAKNGYYDNVTFHRVINEFMIQGGDPEGTGTGGESIWGGYFEDEFSPKARNFNGALSMANIGQADTNSSQFFIVNAPTFTQDEIDYYKANGINISDEDAKVYMERGGTPHLDDKHTVFGMVYEGMSIVQKIMEVEVNADNAMPTTPVVIEKIEILEVK